MDIIGDSDANDFEDNGCKEGCEKTVENKPKGGIGSIGLTLLHSS